MTQGQFIAVVSIPLVVIAYLVWMNTLSNAFGPYVSWNS